MTAKATLDTVVDLHAQARLIAEREDMPEPLDRPGADACDEDGDAEDDQRGVQRGQRRAVRGQAYDPAACTSRDNCCSTLCDPSSHCDCIAEAPRPYP